MFNLQGGEIIIILLLALVVLGPEKLPDAMRKAGQFYAELKKLSSGFQSEFKAAVEEPMREIRDTANVVRDSADFTKLQSGERDEKPKSGEMADADPAKADEAPSAELPTFDSSAGDDPAPELTDDSKLAPFRAMSASDLQPVERPAPPPDDVDTDETKTDEPDPASGNPDDHIA